MEIFDQVLRRLEAEKGAVNDAEYFADFNKYEKKHKFDLKGWFREFNRYHGLPKQDAVFFNMSDLICDLASKEDCIIMGRCADAILKNNHIPHISLFITAPFAIRVQHVMDVRKMNMKQAVRFLKRWTASTDSITIFTAELSGASRIITIFVSTVQATESMKRRI